MNKYSPKAQQVIEKTMKEFHAGKLKSGSSGGKVTSRKQALAIGISEARAKHYKTPEAES